jgi:hypothetical protein
MPEAHSCDSERANNRRARELWLQMQACDSQDAEWLRLREELYQMYEVLALGLGVRYFGNKRLSPDDIRQCCRIGVILAIDDWEPWRGTLTTMIHYHVSQEIRAWLRVEGMYRPGGSTNQDNDSQETCQGLPRQKCDLTYVSWETFRSEEHDVDFTEIGIEQGVDSHEEELVLQVTVHDALQVLAPDRRQLVEMYHGLNGHDKHALRHLEPVFDKCYQTIKNRLDAAHREMSPYLEGYR